MSKDLLSDIKESGFGRVIHKTGKYYQLVKETHIPQDVSKGFAIIGRALDEYAGRVRSGHSLVSPTSGMRRLNQRIPPHRTALKHDVFGNPYFVVVNEEEKK